MHLEPTRLMSLYVRSIDISIFNNKILVKLLDLSHKHLGQEYTKGLNKIRWAPEDEKLGIYFTTVDKLTEFSARNAKVAIVHLYCDSRICEVAQNLYKTDKLNVLSFLTIEEFARRFPGEINWDSFSANFPLSEQFMRDFCYRLNWHNLTVYQKMNEEFVVEMEFFVDWSVLTLYHTFSEHFLHKYKKKINWKEMTVHQRMSEDFIRKSIDYVDWNVVSCQPYLSSHFKKEFCEKINQEVRDWYKESYGDQKSWYEFCCVGINYITRGFLLDDITK